MKTDREFIVNTLKNMKNVRDMPFLSGLLAILFFLFSCGFCFNDKSTSQRLLDLYVEHNILAIEAPVYRDFLERSLNVELQGSAKALQYYEALRVQNESADMVRMLAADRRFFPYLDKEGPLFLPEADYKHWRKIREEQINPLINELSAASLGVIPERFHFSSILTHSLTDHSLFRMLGGCLLLVSLALLIEQRIVRGRLALMWLLSFSACSLLYAVLGSPYSPAWLGVSWYWLSLLGLLLAASWPDYRTLTLARLRENRPRLIWTAAGVVLVLAAWALEAWHGYLDAVGALCNALVFGVAVFCYPLLVKKPQTEQPDVSEANLEWSERIGLSQAMQAIAALEFDRAREQLQELMRLHPDSRIILEQLYCLEKLQPEGETFWACARKRVEFAQRHNDYPMMCQLFADVQKGASSKERARPRLKPDHYHQMMAVFLAHSDLERAEKAYLFLELAGDAHIIQEACRTLQLEFKRRNDSGRAHHYQVMLERMSAS
jgi:hypothetical protein